MRTKMPSSTKKFLDKQGIKWYNIRREGKDGKVNPLTIKFMEMFDRYASGVDDKVKIKWTSFNEEQTLITKNKIVEIGNAVREVAEVFMPGARLPIIAGGAVRDMFFGMEPKDYDVFFDVSTISDEDGRDDFVLLFADAVRHKLMATTEPDQKFTRLRSVGLGGSYGSHSSDVNAHGWATGKFFVYETLPDNEVWGQYLNEQFAADPHAVINNPIRVQIIGHIDPNLANDVPKFIEGFDYGLVKCWYDPSDEEFVFTDEFKEVLETKKIVYTENQTAERVGVWSNRWYWGIQKWNPETGKNGGPVFPFQLVNNAPNKSVNPYFSKSTGSGYQTLTGAPWAQAGLLAGMPVRMIDDLHAVNNINDNF